MQFVTDHVLQSKEKPATDKPIPFGRIFTDHMLIWRWTNKGGWGPCHLQPYQHISISPAACGIHYAQTAFDGFKAFYGSDGRVRIFRFYEHLKRFRKSAARLRLPCPEIHDLATAILEYIKIESSWALPDPGCSLYIRPLLLGTEPYLGIDPGNECLLIVIASPIMSLYGKNGLKIKVETEHVRASEGGLGDVKAGANYAAAIDATAIAKEDGYGQVLWTDRTHQFCGEMGSMNLFAVIGDTIVTPELDGTILPGQTRETAIVLLREAGWKVEERRLTVDELFEASGQGRLHSLFGTGTAATICAVTELVRGNDRALIPTSAEHTVPRLLLDRYDSIQRLPNSDPHDWMTIVPL